MLIYVAYIGTSEMQEFTTKTEGFTKYIRIRNNLQGEHVKWH
jgi:hypothetical protein